MMNTPPKVGDRIITQQNQPGLLVRFVASLFGAREWLVSGTDGHIHAVSRAPDSEQIEDDRTIWKE